MDPDQINRVKHTFEFCYFDDDKIFFPLFLFYWFYVLLTGLSLQSIETNPLISNFLSYK